MLTAIKYAHLSPCYLKETVACLDMPRKVEEKREVDTNLGQVLALPATKITWEKRLWRFCTTKAEVIEINVKNGTI